MIGEGALVRQQHVHRLAEAAEGEVEPARTSSGSSTRTQASRSLVSATDWKNLIAAACRLQPRQLVYARHQRPWISVVEKMSSASCSFADTPQ